MKVTKVMNCHKSHELIWIVMNCHKLSWIVMNCYELSWIVMNCHELSWNLRLSWTGLSEDFSEIWYDFNFWFFPHSLHNLFGQHGTIWDGMEPRGTATQVHTLHGDWIFFPRLVHGQYCRSFNAQLWIGKLFQSVNYDLDGCFWTIWLIRQDHT